MTSETDLERKTENAIAKRLKQHQALARKRMRNTSEDSAKVNEDIVICAKRGEGNPPFSGIFDMTVTVSLSMRYQKSVETLPLFVALTAAMEQVLCGVDTYKLASQLSLCVANFHCYEVSVVGKDDAPQEQKHSCVWTLNAIVMPQDYNTAAKLNPQPQ